MQMRLDRRSIRRRASRLGLQKTTIKNVDARVRKKGTSTIPTRSKGTKKRFSITVHTTRLREKMPNDRHRSYSSNDKRREKRTGDSNRKILYYGRAVDDTMLHALNCLATRVNNGTERTTESLKHFLDYCYDNPDAVKLYLTSDMILFIVSNAACLVEPMAQS